MTAGDYGYGSMRATDADRENVRQILQDAHAQGRLSWDEFDSRTTTLLNAQTYGQLAELTSDLPSRIPAAQPQVYQPGPYGVQRPTNGMAIAALICGVCQIFFWFVAGIPAIVLGHMARRQIRQTGEAGDGMALTGMILGYIGLALTALFVILIVIIAVSASQRGINYNPPVGP
jgi:Domain of unknown function (DUF4190)/Domain of unknown function (DUF1707)